MHNSLSCIVSKSEIGDILNNVLEGERLNLHNCKELLKSDDVYTIGLVANTLRKTLFGNTATFINNIILNYT
ncbi:MAG: cofH2, partial [Nitrososphaeraceae archaeon]|nr:cofH2 [Nitrososphaeraceae archaeon]